MKISSKFTSFFSGPSLGILFLILMIPKEAIAQLDTIKVYLSEKQQIIDGFGAHQGDNSVNESWWQDLYYNDIKASIYRVDLTPQLVSPYSDLQVYSPWFMGTGTDSVFNLEDPDNPDGPEGNRVRTYTGADYYSRAFGGENAPIAVMGPDIDENVKYFTYRQNDAITVGLSQKEELGDFKLIGSFWSPLPWVKVSSGNNYNQNWWPGPVQGTPWPFIWGGNYGGGRLDVSDTPLAVFDDSALGGSGPTSALTQFARSTAAYVRGFQDYYSVRFYAISIQNELNFEQFYNSATYPLSSQYITAIKAVREEFDKYDDLKDIRLMGPEDLLGGDAYGMWQYGGGANTIHKNLQYLQNLAADPDALAAVDFFCIHGYDGSGVSSSGAASTLWDWWLNGWDQSPAAGIPANVSGYSAYNKKSWMTETSGENPAWLFPAAGYPNNGGWGLALRIHQALTSGRQSAWVYWTFTETGDQGNTTEFALTNQSLGANSPKYVAAKHYFRHIRPGAYRVSTETVGSQEVLSSAYIHEDNGTVTLVLINTDNSTKNITVSIPGLAQSDISFDQYTSSNNQYWQTATTAFSGKLAQVSLPAYSVMTLYGNNALSTALLDRQWDRRAPFRLMQNIPNPFRDQTLIRFELDKSAHVLLQLYDLKGLMINTLCDGRKGPGLHEVPIRSDQLVPGIYVYTLTTGGISRSKKLTIIK